MLSLEGTQLGNYDVIRRMRIGGMGAVYEGRQRTAFDRRVAIKVILGDYATDPDMRRRFAREAKTVARLQHPHILPLIEFGDAQGILYLVMPFIDGGTLTSYLRHNLPGLGEVATMYQQLLDAVECAHDHGLIHRDIKSSNVLLDLRRNMPPYTYLADFGLVRAVRPNGSNQVGKPIPLEQVPGTPHYMAPEQTFGIVTPLTDIYALGVMLYQMLTGNLPYNDPDEVRVIQMHLHDPIPSPCEQDVSIPVELDEVVRTAMAKQPEDRYQTIAELRTAFLAAIQGPALTLSVPESARPRSTRQLDPSEPTEANLAPAPSPIPEARNRNTAALRRAMDPPKPILMHQQRPRGTEMSPHVAISDKREHPGSGERAEKIERHHSPEAARPFTQSPEESLQARPSQRKRRLFLIVTTLVIGILILLLIIPRILGISTSVPIIGASSSASILITLKSSDIQNSFILTASPQTKTTDLGARTIPDRLLTSTADIKGTIATTGTNKTKGQQAQGLIRFINITNSPIQVNKGLTLNAGNGIQVQINQDTTVPPQQNNQPGQIDAAATATQTGQAGNIATDAIKGTCCKPTLFTSNPQPFVGGTNDTNTHFFSQADLDTAKADLLNKIQAQINTQLQQQIQDGETMTGVPDYKIVTLDTDNAVGSSADKVQIRLKVQGSVAVYQKSVAEATANVLLNRYAQKKLGPDYQLQGKQILIGTTKAETGKGGVIYLTLNIRGTWRYTFSDDQINNLRSPLKGITADAAKAYLQSQPGIASVDIRLPFGSDHLPSNSDSIAITLTTQ